MKSTALIEFGLLYFFTELGRFTDSFNCDRCRDANLCETVTGTFRVTGLGKGYHPVLVVPRGACNLNVTELGKSTNILALKDIARNEYIFNGYWSTAKAGVYNGAGASFIYGKSDGCPGECVYAEGPILSKVLAQLLYLDTNPGIFYTYKLSKHLKDTPEVTTLFPVNATYRHPPSDPRSELREFGVGYQDIPEQGASPPVPSSNGGFPKFIPIPGHQGIHHRGPIFSSDFSHRRKQNNSQGRRNSRKENANKRRQALTDVTFSRGVDDETIRRENVNFDTGHIGSDISLEYGTEIHEADNKSSSVLEEYVWILSKSTPCSRPCGGGIQERVYECIESTTLEAVDELHCDPSVKPDTHHAVCNEEPCTPMWHEGQWSACSVSCGEGYHTREVTCTQRISATDTQQLDDMYCTSQKPAVQKQCYTGTCYRWVSGDWGDCSRNCGSGLRYRVVQCRDDAGRVVESRYCDHPAPTTAEPCEMGACTSKWYFSSWDSKCSVDCGTGIVTRKVYCATDSGQALADDSCDVRNKPEAEKQCISSTGCGDGNGKWFTGPWSQCSLSCGNGTRSRHVVCMAATGSNMLAVADSNCEASDKPRDRKECMESDCGYMWLRAEWSECSKTCDGGLRTRAVKCVNTKMEASNRCNEEDQPTDTEDCNTGECWDPRPSPSDKCADKYPNCDVVVQARLCRYPYYQRKCCRSCSTSKRLY